MTVEEALAYASVMHEGRIERGIRAMEALRRERLRSAQSVNKPELLDGPQAGAEMLAAVLFDVLASTPATVPELYALGCPAETIGALEALTPKRGETRAEHLARAAVDPIARRVLRVLLQDVGDEPALAELGEWERHWAVVETQRNQPGGHFQYFLDGDVLVRQWRWRETGQERSFAWPERAHPMLTGGFWQPVPLDRLTGVEIPRERAAQEALRLSVALDAARIRDWTDRGPIVRFGGLPPMEAEEIVETPAPEPPAPGIFWRVLIGAAAGVGAAALVQRALSKQQRKPKE